MIPPTTNKHKNPRLIRKLEVLCILGEKMIKFVFMLGTVTIYML